MDKNLIQLCFTERIEDLTVISIPDDIFLSLDRKSAAYIVDYFKSNTMLKLPKREIEFFEWLKKNDPKVWDDLWSDSEDNQYLVSISFLPILTDKLSGFPICDLIKHPNYYFTSKHIEGKEAKLFIDSIRARFMEKEKLTLEQTILLQISTQATDIWHFAYHFNVDINRCKAAVKNLSDENMLIHLTDAEHLIPFIEI